MPITDYESEQDRIKRALVDALRLQQDSDQPQGRMVSGHFVAPSWTEQLAPVVNQVMGGYKQHKAEGEQKELSQRAQQELSDWMASRPKSGYQESSVSEEIPGTTAPGPQMESPDAVIRQPGQMGPMPDSPAPGPLMKTRMVRDRQEIEPTREQQLNWAGQGIRNPLSKTLATEYMKDQLIQAPEREENRRWRSEESALARQAKAEAQMQQHRNKLAELTIASGDKTKTREQQLEVERMKDATKRAMGALEATNKYDIALLKAKAAGQKTTPVPPRVIHDLSEAKQVAEGISDSFVTFKPEYGGISGFIDKVSGKYNPFSSKEADAAAAWWNRYEQESALVERHAKFGTALSKSERDLWAAATIKDLTNPQLIAQNLKMRAELSTKFYNRLREEYIKGGYGLVDDAFDPISESFTPIEGGGGIPPTVIPNVQRPSPAPQRPLPASTGLPPGVTRRPGT